MAERVNTKLIADLLIVLEESLPLFRSNRAHLRRQLAAAGLARCAALLEGMLLLLEAGREDVHGVLARALFEAWLVSLYVLLKGKDPEDDAVLVELGAAHFKALRAINSSIALGKRSQRQIKQWQKTSRSDKKGKMAQSTPRPSTLKPSPTR